MIDSTSQQKPNVIVIEKGEGELPDYLPDGFDDLAKYNLITYKSMHEVLDSWALDELLGYFVDYRKQLVAEGEALPPRESFKLYALSTSFPQKLSEEVEFVPELPGVYGVRWGSIVVKVIVLSEIRQEKHNALWNLFSAEREQIIYGLQNYQSRSEGMDAVMGEIVDEYQKEGIDVPKA